MVFVKAVHEARQLNDLELKIYDSWFNPMLARNRNLTPDGFVYLKTQPDTCMRRLRHRNRSEEAGIGGGYLSRLSDFHEEWLSDGATPVGELLSRANAVRMPNGQSIIQTNSTLFPHGSAPEARVQLHAPDAAAHG